MEFDPTDVFDVISTLLGPNGCPWDKKQTPDSLCEYLIEEIFEFVEAVRGGTKDEIEEELGDVYFLLFFISYLLDRENKIKIKEVFKKNVIKMKNRHPHVFGDVKVSSEQEILTNWEKIKKTEKNHKDKNPMDSIPKHLPPLIKAYRIHSKAEKLGFTWDTNIQQEDALKKELEEFLEAKNKSQEDMEEEFGDFLFSLIEYGRRNNIKANSALQKAINKFLLRFNKMLEIAKKKNVDFSSLTQNEKDRLWDEAKKQLNNPQNNG